jgi:hypothetical protein
MNTLFRLAVCGVALSVPAWSVLRAADPAPARPTGRVLVLADTERTLEGDIEAVGGQYRIRRALGETWVPGDQVLCLVSSREEAYQFLRKQANLRDPDERLRLARWCQERGLRQQALEEVTAAVELRPRHAESQRLLSSWQRSLAAASTPAPAPPSPEAEPVPVPTPPVDLSAQALGLFTARVQPILMNACASCHAGDRGGSFKLVRAIENGVANRRATQQNLAAVLARINLDRPQASPLLTKAVGVHGEASQPPLKDRKSPAYRTLEEWVRLAVADAPARDSVAPPAVAAVAEPKTGPEPVTPKSESTFAVGAPQPIPAPQASSPPPPSVEKTALAPKPPADPFDPEVFNQQK